MKKITAILIAVLLIAASLVSCGEKKTSEKKQEDTGVYEVALILDSNGAEDGGFNQKTWSSVKSFCSSKDLTCRYYTADKDKKDVYLDNVKKAVGKGAGMVIFAGSSFETAAYDAQKEYPDISFLILDGMPHSSSNKYDLKNNMTGVMFAEEEAGFLAGYAAVKDGYDNIGFIGGKETPAVKRYGYGFVQGADAAAKDMGLSSKVKLRYSYTAADKAGKKASDWYGSGTQVIFACGAGVSETVCKAAEDSERKVIGSDVDQSGISETVITTAEKNIRTAAEDVLRGYAGDSFNGGTAFNYAAKNDGVKLEMKNSRFSKFTGDDYKKIFSKLKKGSVELKKDTEADSVKDVLGGHVELIK